MSASESTASAPYPFLLTCGGQSSGPNSDFHFSGTATGPYAGSFTESGSASYDTSGGPPTATGPVEAYTTSFTINSADATVTGTETITGSATATCNESPGGEALQVGPVSTSYSATITTADGTSIDEGTSAATVSQSVGNIQGNWFASLKAGSFVSTASSTAPPTLSNITATVDPNGNVEVSVDTSPSVINAVLYKGKYNKVAPDVTPVGGVASWTVTGLRPGCRTLHAVGFTVPSGQPGGQISTPVSVSVTIPRRHRHPRPHQS